MDYWKNILMNQQEKHFQKKFQQLLSGYMEKVNKLPQMYIQKKSRNSNKQEILAKQDMHIGQILMYILLNSKNIQIKYNKSFKQCHY